MKALQLLIVMAVVGVNIHYGWTGNGYAVGFAALLIVIVLTVWPVWIYDWFMRRQKQIERWFRSSAT